MIVRDPPLRSRRRLEFLEYRKVPFGTKFVFRPKTNRKLLISGQSEFGTKLTVGTFLISGPTLAISGLNQVISEAISVANKTVGPVSE